MFESVATLGVGLVGCVVWAIRQEGLIKNAEMRLTRCEKELDDVTQHLRLLDEKIFKELLDIKISLAEIRGAVSSLNHDQQMIPCKETKQTRPVTFK
jgi:hypothetical protein